MKYLKLTEVNYSKSPEEVAGARVWPADTEFQLSKFYLNSDAVKILVPFQGPPGFPTRTLVMLLGTQSSVHVKDPIWRIRLLGLPWGKMLLAISIVASFLTLAFRAF